MSSQARAEDPIGVASIHDLSGGLDIYGKPMVDALTLAVEEANAAGGLLGRQIKLINYDYAKYGASAERRRLIARWEKDVNSLPK